MPANPDDCTFTSYRESNYRGFLIGICLVIVVETIAVHLLLMTFVSHLWAWVATTLAVSSAWWMWKDWKGLQENPTRTHDSGISMRLGTRWSGEIPRQDLQSVKRIQPFTATPGGDRPAGVFQLRLTGEPNVELTFRRDVDFEGPFGIKKVTRALRVQLDDADRFVSAAQALVS